MKKSKINLSETRNSDSANLLISILIRFPQIGTVKLDSKKGLIGFDFMLSNEVAETELELYKEKLLQMLNAYHFVTQFKPSNIQLELRNLFKNYKFLSIRRDLASLSRGELSLIITSLADTFSARLLMDETGGIPDSFDEFGFPDELIDSMLENLRINKTSKNLTAMRENGRVLVFSN